MFAKIAAAASSVFFVPPVSTYPVALHVSHLVLRTGVALCALSILFQPVAASLCSRLPLTCDVGGEMVANFYWFWGLSSAGVLLHYYLNSVAAGLTWNQAEDEARWQCLASNQRKDTSFAMSYILFWIFSPAYLLVMASW